MIKSAIFPLVASAFLGTASASVSFLFDADVVADANGSPISLGSAIMLVVDTAGDGFGEVIPGAATVGDFLNGVDDQIIFVDTPGNTIGVEGAFSGASDPINLGDGAGVPSEGDLVGAFWFPEIGIDDSFDAGQAYGFYTDQVGIDGSSVFTVPADGTSNYVLGFFTSDSVNVAGSNPPSAGHASLTVIPEPSALSLLLFAVAGVALRRRR